MTTDLQELGARVAKALGWKSDYDENNHQVTYKRYWYKNGRFHAREYDRHTCPSDPGECFKLCAEFNVWPVSHLGAIIMLPDCPGGEVLHNISIPHDNTPVGRLNAAIEAVLLTVLAKKEQS